MLNFLTTLGAETEFQKNRLILTKPNYEAPNQQAIKNILHTFAGEDQQTRAQIAYACIIKKINNSASKDNWLYLLKNLIILDRIMSENRFCQQLAQTTLPTIQNYISKDLKCLAINAKGLLIKYWQLIQDICNLKIQRKHILFYKRCQRKGYLQSLGVHQIFIQIQVLQKIFDSCISLIFLTSGISNNKQQMEKNSHIVQQKSKKYYNEFTSSNLAQHLNIHFYSKLLTFFSCQYLCIHKFIQIILRITKASEKNILQDVRQFKKMIYKFKKNCQDMILIAQKNKNKKGFQHIDTKQFNAFSEQHIIKVIDQFIRHHTNENKYNAKSHFQSLITLQTQNLRLHSDKFVERKPLVYDQNYSVIQKSPRKVIDCRKQIYQNGVFDSYFNAYSDEFPHKNMMTLQLIQDIRRDQQRQYKQILQGSKGQPESINSVQKQKFTQQSQKDFFKQFRMLKRRVKLSDLLIFGKIRQKQQEKEDSTNYSFINSSRRMSLFEVLSNVKWQQAQHSQA